jgi:hypothetical protein
MAIQVCFICVFNDPGCVENHAVVYADCDDCARPVCKKHGRDVPSEQFYCIRCLRVRQLTA